MTGASIPCPQCEQPVDPQARLCPNCGTSLARAAALAEQALRSAIVVEKAAPMAPEILVPRLGEYLIERGVLNQEDLDRALEYARRNSEAGRPRLLGQVLLELGLVDRETLDQVVTEQILELQNALQQSNHYLEQRVKERTRELQNALSKLSELNQLKTNFISNVSHELRTPLTHLKGYLDLLADGSLGPLTRDQADALAVLQRSESRLEELIDELLQFSLAASDQLFLEMRRVDAYGLVSQSVTRAMGKARERKISLRADLQADVPALNVDPEKMGWVFDELLDNAIKFTEPGGQVEITLKQVENLVVVAVIDSGIGIAPEHLSEIFEPFHQLDGSITRRFGGVGLGLSLARKIVEAHGAAISVQSELGKGTCFRIALPVLYG